MKKLTSILLVLVALLLSACGGTPTKKAVVVAPAITEFTASSDSITAGDDVTLSWTVTGTALVKLSISSLGDVTGSSTTVSPTETTTYTLTASNSAGNVTKNLTITVAPKPAELAIKNVDSVITNQDPTFSANSARISFYIDFSKELKADDIKSLIIVAENATNRSWSIEDAEFFKESMYTFPDGSTGLAVDGLLTTALTDNASAIYLGGYGVLIKLKDSTLLNATFTVPVPGSRGVNGKKYGYTESYPNPASLSSEYVHLLKRAQIKSAAINDSGSDLSVTFTIADERAYNGTV